MRSHRTPTALSSRFPPTWRAAFAVAPLALGADVLACTPKIGDTCRASTDCSTRGDRLCDTSQPGGYCTTLNCRGGSCADEAVCVLFGSALPGCSYDDRAGPLGSRVARSFCMSQCESDGDCRDGYRCADPRIDPWNAVVLDNEQNRRTCLPVPKDALDGGAPVGSAIVCGPAAAPVPPIDAGPAQVFEAGVLVPPLLPPDAGADAGG